MADSRNTSRPDRLLYLYIQKRRPKQGKGIKQKIGKRVNRMNRNQKLLIVFSVLTIPAAIALYSIAQWAIWAIVLILLFQGLNFYYSTKKMLSNEKKEWDEKWQN